MARICALIGAKGGYNCQDAVSMKSRVETHFQTILQHLYINPLERCNIACKICYTRKTAPKLTEKQIVDFVEKYQKVNHVRVITFCGGEVMMLSYFPHLVNTLNTQGIYIQIITNGTIDRLGEFLNPGQVNMIVSIDGLEAYHDRNRGAGNFLKSMYYLEKAILMGFHREIFSIVTRDNFVDIEKFEKYMQDNIGKIDITYHPRKPPEYLLNHPISNIQGALKGFGYVESHQLKELYKHKKVFPPPELGCYQISLVSDGKVYGCCEGTIPIGHMDDSITDLIMNLRKRVESWESEAEGSPCLRCSQPDFMCGMKSIHAIL